MQYEYNNIFYLRRQLSNVKLSWNHVQLQSAPSFMYSWTLNHIIHSRLLTPLEKEAFENIGEKEKMRNQHFLLFSTLSQREIVILATFNISSADAFNSVMSKKFAVW